MAEALKVVAPDLPLLFMSGYSEDAIRYQGLLIPGASLLRKPFTLAGIAATLGPLLRRQVSSLG